jgi:hypothetical protein
MLLPLIKLTDPGLFGNDAAEDEEEAVFSSYVLERDEIKEFIDQNEKIRIVRAYKGEGKSALLRLAKTKLASLNDDGSIIISTTGPSLSPDINSDDSDKWVRGWKEQIFRLIASEIGARIGMAWGDDTMSLVEEAERSGFKSKSIISAIIERLKFKDLPVEKKEKNAISPEKVVQRWAKGKPLMWLFVDDVDQNFQNNSLYKTKIASFFIAARHIVGLVPELRLRLAVRPNVWTTVSPEFEALSHIRQYISDLKWSQDSIRRLLAQRIEGYLMRTGQDKYLTQIHTDAWPRDETIINYVFEAPMRWGQKDKSPYIVMGTLSMYRPRWLIELSKVAAKNAFKKNKNIISLTNIESELAEFGRNRIADNIAEFKSQCAQIEDLITAFAQQPETYKTDQIIALIEKRILPGVAPRITGIPGIAKALDVAAFLYEIGFLSARRDMPDGSYNHLNYSENPLLLHSRTNIDQGVSWEIHPIYRQALELNDKVRETKKKKWS